MDVDSSSKSGPSTMVPIAIGLVGVLLGAIALFMAVNNGSAVTSKLNDLSAKVDDASTKATQAAAGQQDLDGKVKLNSDNIAAMNSQMKDFVTQASAILQKQTQAITELQASKSSKVATTTAKGAKTSGAGESSGPGGTHTIAAGDNFSTIARKYGVSVAAIEAANPGVESSKLKVGQKINLPGKSSGAATGSAPAAPTPEPVTPAASTP